MAEDLAKGIVQAAEYLQNKPRPITYATVQFDDSSKMYTICRGSTDLIVRSNRLAKVLNWLEDEGFRCQSADLEVLSRLHITKSNIVVLSKPKEET